MGPVKANRKGWSLRLRVLAPIIILVVVCGTVIVSIQATVANRQVQRMVEQRGESLLGGVTGRLQERQNAEEGFARLLAQHSDVVRVVQAHDSKELASILRPFDRGFGLGQLVVMTYQGTELLHLGEHAMGDTVASLAQAARAGATQSAMVMNDRGLTIFAAAPIHYWGVVSGVMVTGSSLEAEGLSQLRTQSGMELAIYRDGRLVSASTRKQSILDALRIGDPASGGLAAINRVLGRQQLRAFSTPLPGGGTLVGVASIVDVVGGAAERSLMGLLTTLGLMLITLLVGLAMSRDIGRPIEAMVTATRDMVRGNYGRRLAGTPIKELNEMAGAVNHLAQQVETQMGELIYQAYHDPLTGLPNRTLFMRRLKQAMGRTDMPPNSLAVLVLDLDDFKVLNDTLGHVSGDKLLVEFAGRLERALRAGDLAARLGGDEFTLLLEGLHSSEDAIAVARRIADDLQKPFTVSSREVFVTASIGIACGSPGSDEPDALLVGADIASYSVKSAGKGNWALYERSMNTAAAQRIQMETDLRMAVERQEFSLVFQPVVQLDSRRITELEALVRWQHPERGLVMPSEFIPFAEESGLIIPIGRWVIREACRKVRSWQEAFPTDPPLKISVNLSARQLRDPALVTEVRAALTDSGLDPATLKVEITETIMVQDADRSVQTVRLIKDLGVVVAIDDFGQGYSALSYLTRFPIDVLKIDRAFVDKLGTDPQETAIVGTIIHLAKTLNLRVTGEGIETGEQFRHLRELGCDQGQGFFFARPMAGDAVGALLAHQALTGPAPAHR